MVKGLKIFCQKYFLKKYFVEIHFKKIYQHQVVIANKPSPNIHNPGSPIKTHQKTHSTRCFD